MVLEIEIKGDMEDKLEESYKKKRKNYAKANHNAKKFFNKTDWTQIKEQKDVHKKYDFSLMIYEWVKEYVLIKWKMNGRKEDLFKGKCERAKRSGMKHGRKLKENRFRIGKKTIN